MDSLYNLMHQTTNSTSDDSQNDNQNTNQNNPELLSNLPNELPDIDINVPIPADLTTVKNNIMTLSNDDLNKLFDEFAMLNMINPDNNKFTGYTEEQYKKYKEMELLQQYQFENSMHEARIA